MKLIIFISKDDDFYASAKRIQDICKIDCNIIYIEEYIENEYCIEINTSDIIYFLCNGEKVAYTFNKLNKKYKDLAIINKKYLSEGISKLFVQQRIKNGGVPTPEIYNISDINNIGFPVFCKQNSHTGIVFRASSKKNIIEFFKKNDINDFYLEEAVTNDIDRHFEFKVYYVNGNVYSKDNENTINDQIINICKDISAILYNLQAFSVDFIKNNTGLYVIDVNVASGFYMSEGARKEFVEKYGKAQ